MSIKETKELKRETETIIRNSLINFSNKTGLIVEDIRFNMMGGCTYKERGGKDVFSCTAVEIKVSIEDY